MNEYSAKAPGRQLPAVTLILILVIIAALSVWNALSDSTPFILALVIQAPLFAIALSSYRSPLVPVFSLVVFALTVVLSHSIASSMMGAMYLPIGLSIAVCAIKKKRFSFTLALSSAVFIVYYALCIAVTLFSVFNKLNTDIIIEYFDVFKQAFYALYGQLGLDESVINQLAVTFFAFIPTSVAVCAMALTAIVLSIYKRAIRIFDLSIDLPNRWALSMSSTSAVVYLISCFIYFVLGQLLGDAIAVTFGNLFMILTPLFAVIGFKKGYSSVKAARGSGRFPGIAIFAIIMFFFNPYYLVIFLGVYGAFSAFPEKKFTRIDPDDTDDHK